MIVLVFGFLWSLVIAITVPGVKKGSPAGTAILMAGVVSGVLSRSMSWSTNCPNTYNHAEATGSLVAAHTPLAPVPPEITLLIVRGFGPATRPSLVPGTKLSGA